MHGYGMAGDLLHLALYLLSIGFWALFFIVCMFCPKQRLKKRLGTHALLIGLLFFPVLPATIVGGALIAFGIESLIWSLCIAGVGIPLAGLQLVRRYA